MNNYKDLLVWQKSRSFVKELYFCIESFPKHEMYALSDQMRRAVISIPSNIAEGCYREWIKEQLHFLSIARWSLAEIETQIFLAEDLWYIKPNESENLQNKTMEISKMLVGLIKKKKEFLSPIT